MIEIIYNKEKEQAVGNEEYFCVPRNIRQVGQPSAQWKIYVEDYVYSFLSRPRMEEQGKGRMAILLGTSNWKDGVFYIFLKSCLLVDSTDLDAEYLTIKDDVWGKIYEEMKQYFPEQDVVGWYLERPDGSVAMTDLIKKVHLTHFGGNNKVLYLADEQEQDTAFFVYKNGKMERQAGYYIFYEKNEAMQAYISEKSPGISVDYTGKPQDRAVNDFRKMIAKKRAEKEMKRADKLFRATTGAAVAAVLVLGIMWTRNTPIGEKVYSFLKREEAGYALEDQELSQELSEVQLEDGVVSEMTSEENALAESLWEEEIQDANLESDVMEEAMSEADFQGDVLEDNSMEDTGMEGTAAEVLGYTLPYTEYTIRPGDTLCGISVRYYGDLSKVDEICKINSMTEEDIIYEGQKILLP